MMNNQTTSKNLGVETLKRLYAAKRASLPSILIKLDRVSGVDSEEEVSLATREWSFRKSAPIACVLDATRSLAGRSFDLPAEVAGIKITMILEDNYEVEERSYKCQDVNLDKVEADVQCMWSNLLTRKLSLM